MLVTYCPVSFKSKNRSEKRRHNRSRLFNLKDLTEGIKVLNKVAELDGGFEFEFTHFPWGCGYYTQYGKMMDEDGLEQLKDFDAIYLGAVGYPGVPDHISLWDLLLKIRKGFDQYVNLRPIKLLNGAPCPLKDVSRDQIDMLVIRENSEGEYAGQVIGFLKGSPMKWCCKQVFFPETVWRESSVMPMKKRESKANHLPVSAKGMR